MSTFRKRFRKVLFHALVEYNYIYFSSRSVILYIVVIVTGRIQTGSYTNKDGVKVYTTDVVAEDQEFAESKNSSSNNGGNFGGSNNFSNEPAPAAAGDGFMNIPDGIEEELPFN